MSLGLMAESSTGLYTAAEASACYTNAQQWVMEYYPNSDAGLAYMGAIDQLTSGMKPYVSESDYYAYIYQPPEGTYGGHSEWQTIAVIDPSFYATWETEPQTASGEFAPKAAIIFSFILPSR